MLYWIMCKKKLTSKEFICETKDLTATATTKRIPSKWEYGIHTNLTTRAESLQYSHNYSFNNIRSSAALLCKWYTRGAKDQGSWTKNLIQELS